MVSGEAKVDGNSLGVANVQISVRLRRETGNDVLFGTLAVDIGEEALLEHGIGVERSLLLLGLGGGLLCGRGSSLLLASLLLGRLLGTLLLSLLQLGLGDHLAGHLVELELGDILGQLLSHVCGGMRSVRGSNSKYGGVASEDESRTIDNRSTLMFPGQRGEVSCGLMAG